jgi:hypothetical protein
MKTITKILLCTLISLSCKKDEVKTKGIELYLPENIANIIACKDFDFTNQKLQATPLITDEDVLSYEWSNHAITLSKSAYTKLKNYKDEKKLGIYPLVLTINGERIYGLFYKYAILSMSCQSTLISENDFGPTNGKLGYSIVHGQGFPVNMLIKDPRGDKRIYDYLKSTGRLVE